MLVAVEFYFVHDCSSILMLEGGKRERMRMEECRVSILHRALVSVLIDGEGEFGDERTLGFEY